MLIPSIGKEQAAVLKNTIQAYQTIAEQIKNSRADSLIVISGHGDRNHQGVTIHLRPSFDLAFDSFGDFDTKTTVPGNIVLANLLKQPFDNQRSNLPIIMTSHLPLDYGLTVPLYVLAQNRSELKTVPLQLRYKKPGPEYDIGQALRPVLQEAPQRIALIVSANLSHRLSAASPAGLSPRARTFDKKIIDLVQARNSSGIKRIRANTLEGVQPCGLGALLFWLGVLEGSQGKIKLTSYEQPFGIGLPTFSFMH
jgi:aromatic ring-opening dioxygenase LigB subunit